MISIYFGPPASWCYGPYELRQRGLRFSIVEIGSDGIVRDLYIGRFWSSYTAMKIAQALMIARRNGERESAP